MAAFVANDFGDEKVNEFVRNAFGAFDFTGIVSTPPTRTFSGELILPVGGREIRLHEVGPAHTKGDLLVEVPDARTVFTGDIVFNYGTPIVWEGPLANWIEACDRIIALDVDVVVPGHGPVTDKNGPEMMRRYLRFVTEEAAIRHAEGMSAAQAAYDIELGEFGEWSDSERLAVNVHTAYNDLDPTYETPPMGQLILEMAKFATT